MPAVTAPLGAVLAGGASRRLGHPKARAMLHGRALICRPLRALEEAVGEVVVVAKVDSPLPDLGAVEIWHEPPLPRHPFCGVITALERAGGRSVLVCPVDLPLITGTVLRRLAEAPPGEVAVAVGPGGRLQPLVARYGPGAVPALAEAAQAGRPAGATVRRLAPELVRFDDGDVFFNVNTVAELTAAEAMLARGR